MQFETKTRRALSKAVAMLLAANVVALVTGLGGDALLGDRGEGDVPGGEQATADLRTVTLVTATDGTQYLADPTTPEGRAAIDQAVERGAVVTTITVEPRHDPVAATSPGRGAATTIPGGAMTADGRLVDVSKLPALPLSIAELDRLLGPVDEVIGDATDTVNGVLGDVTDTVNGTAGDLTDRVNETVGQLPLPAPTLPTVTAPPVTVPRVTAPRVTVPTVTVPPTTAPPVTAPPVTAPPVTAPPVTAPPVTAPAVTAPPVTAPPVTAPPTTTAPLVTVPPTTIAPTVTTVLAPLLP